MRSAALVLLIVLTLAPAAAAQNDFWRFRWQQGQALIYRVEHNTSVAETKGGTKMATASRLKLLKRWQVVDVDVQGAATLQLTLLAMRNEQTLFSGEVLLFDSEDPARNTPDFAAQMQKYIGKSMAELRVDWSGKVLDVKQGGTVARYQCEPPLLLQLAPTPIKAGESWERTYAITLEPPYGTGEKYTAVQTYQCKQLSDKLATLALTTVIKNMPESPLDRLPLLQKQPTGEIVFDVQNGRLERARLLHQIALENQEGKGSSYRYESVYTEEFVPPTASAQGK